MNQLIEVVTVETDAISVDVELPDQPIVLIEAVIGGISPTYTLPIASTTILGGVKIDGSTIIINGSGVISSTGSSGGGGGIAEAPNDGKAYSRKSLSWSLLTSGDVTTALTFTPYNATNPSKYQTDAQVTAALTPYALTVNLPVPATVNPIMDGTVSPGSGTKYAREDHIHPNDTTKYDVSNPAGYQNAAQISVLLTPYALTANVPVGSTTNPLMDSTAAPGGGTKWSRDDHVHPTDTTRYAASNPSKYQTDVQVAAVLPVVNTVTTPIMDGTATIGTLVTYARPDHIHPTDTTRYAASNPSGYQTASDVTTKLAPYALTTSLPAPATVAPLIDGTATVGTQTKYAREDHIHPTDTTRYATSNPSGYQTASDVSTAITAAKSPYTIAGFAPGVMTASQVLLVHQVGQQIIFPADFGNSINGGTSRSGSITNATGSTTFIISRCTSGNDPTNGSNFIQIGTMVFAPGGHVGTLTTAGNVAITILANEFIKVTAPLVPDVALANVFFTLVGNR